MTVKNVYPTHTPSHRAYSKGCRCDGCRYEHRIYERTRKRFRDRPDGPGPSFTYVSSKEAQAHLLWLARKGVGIRQISKVSGISKSTLQNVRAGEIVKIRSTTNDRILGMNLFILKPHDGRHPSNQPTYKGKDK